MRIVQTFWTAGRDPLKYSFGWAHPEYNLMSWTLSCLSLREHYDEVALYTDQEGYDVLVNKLHLPYTEVNVVYDKNLCLPQHWAYAKIKTYSMQTKPFIHVDGDVYLPHPIPEDISNAPLIAQNKEIGTEYYKRMIDKILQVSSVKLPKYLADSVMVDSVPSYNMGIFGGRNFAFIKKYCEEAQILCDTNKDLNLNGNFNLLFEQILLAYLVKKERLMVSTPFTQVFNDNGYSIKDFCQLDRFGDKDYYHVLGGHKRNSVIIDSLEETFISMFPDYYKLIVSLFPPLYHRGLKKSVLCVPLMFSDSSIKPYIEFLNEAEAGWSNLSWKDIFEVESMRFRGKALSYHEERLDNELVLRRNPYLKCFDVPTSWGSETVQKMKTRLSCKEDALLQKIAVIPILSTKLRKEYVLFESEIEVLEQLNEQPMHVKDLLNELISKSISENMRSLWMNEIRILLNEGILIPYLQTN